MYFNFKDTAGIWIVKIRFQLSDFFTTLLIPPIITWLMSVSFLFCFKKNKCQVFKSTSILPAVHCETQLSVLSCCCQLYEDRRTYKQVWLGGGFPFVVWSRCAVWIVHPRWQCRAQYSGSCLQISSMPLTPTTPKQLLTTFGSWLIWLYIMTIWIS